MVTIAGIDPGKTGAVFVIHTKTCIYNWLDMPVRFLGPNSKRTEVDANVLTQWLCDNGVTNVIIEDVWSLPHDGHVGAFRFGASSGVLIGICAGLGLPLERVRPQRWKKVMKVSADKTEARNRAMILLPEAANLFKRVKDEGRAESALISLYGLFNLGINLKRTPAKSDRDKIV